MKHLKLFLYAQVVLLLLLGCNKIKDGVGEPDNAVYINESLAYRPINFSVRAGAVVQNSLLLTPRLIKAENHVVNVSLGVDNGLVIQYNEVNGTSYDFLPAKYYEIPANSLSIPANSVSGGTVTVNFKITDPFPKGKLYLLPVTITNTSGLPTVNSSKTAFYLIGDNSGGARIVATTTNNAFKVDFTGAPGLSQFTFEAMVYGNKFDRLISTVMGIEGSVLLRIGDAGIPGNQMQMVMPGAPNLNAGTGGELSANQWHHVAAVYNGQTVSVYLDGVLAKSGAASGTVSVANNFYLGYSYDNQRYIDGMMCEARVWSIARTQQELIANKDYVAPETTGLLAYWSLDDNTGNVAIDKTGHGYNATATSPIVWVQSVVK